MSSDVVRVGGVTVQVELHSEENSLALYARSGDVRLSRKMKAYPNRTIAWLLGTHKRSFATRLRRAVDDIVADVRQLETKLEERRRRTDAFSKADELLLTAALPEKRYPRVS